MAYQMAPLLVTLNDLEGHFPRSFPFACAIRRTFAQHFNRFQLTALRDKLFPKWAWLMAPLLVTLNVLEGHFPRSFPICRTF